MSLKHRIKTSLENLSGYYIHKKSDLPVGVDLRYDIQFKLRKIKLNTIFDVGANTGQTAIKWAQLYPGAKLYSFEPIAATFQKLRNNTSPYPNVSCQQLAFGDKTEEVEIKLFEEQDSELNSLLSGNMNSSENSRLEKIRVTTIDAFLQENQIPGIDLLKIDTEGFEIHVLNGALDAFRLNKVKLIYIEVGLDNAVDKRHQLFTDIHQFLAAQNFVFFGLYEIAHSLLASRYHFANALYVHASCI